MKTKYLLTAVATVVLGCWGLPALAQEEEKLRPETNNTDVTEWIVNHSFDKNTTTGWQNAEGVWGFGGGSLNYYKGTPEVYGRAFDSWQDLTAIPAGKYSVTVQAWCNRSNRSYFYNISTIGGYKDIMVGDGISGNLQTVTEYFQENPDNRKLTLADIVVIDGELRIGIKWNGLVRDGWVVFDNFKLTYVDDGYAEIKAAYETKKTEASSIVSGNYPKGLRDRLSTLLKSTVADNSDGYATAWVDLNDITSLCTSDETSELMKVIDAYTKMAEGNETLTKTVDDAESVANTSLATVTTTAEITAITETFSNTCKTAIEENAVDKVIDISTFENGDITGWSGSTPGPEWGVEEFYNVTFDFHKSLSYLPSGWYQITLNAFYRVIKDAGVTYKAGKEINTYRIYANDYELPMMALYEEIGTTGGDANYPTWRSEANANFENGKYLNTINVLVTDGNLTFGLKNLTWVNTCWCCFDNVKVTYKGSDLSTMYTAMSEQALANAAKVNTSYVEKMTTIINENKPASEDAYTVTHIETLRDAMKEYIELRNAKAQYLIDDKFGLHTSKKDALLAVSEATEEVASAFNSSFTDAENAFNTVQSVEDVNAIIPTLETARLTFIENSLPKVGDVSTVLLKDAACTDDAGRYWFRNGNAGGYVENQEAFNNDVYSGNGICYWNGTAQTNIKMIWQDTFAPRPGIYRFTAYAGTALAVANPATYSGNAYVFCNEDQTLVTDCKYAPYTAEINITSSDLGTLLSVGLYAGLDNAATWAMMANTKLEYLGLEQLELDEKDETYEAPVGEKHVDVTLTRSLKSGDKWNTFCVPFDMTAEQLAENHITEVRTLKETSEVQGEAITLFFDKVDEIKASVPCLVKVGEDYTGTISMKNITVNAAEPGSLLSTPGITMQGNYAAMNVPQGAFFINNNVFYEADVTNVSLKGFRAYITIEEPAIEVNRMLINIDGEVTGIEEVLGSETSDEAVDVYTLSGVKMKSGVKRSEALDGLQRGIYVVNGEKVVK